MSLSLAYVCFESPNAEDWRTFGPDILGLQPADDGADGSVRLRVDAHPWRLAIRKGVTDRVERIGWEVEDLASFEAARERLANLGVAHHNATPEELADRETKAMLWFSDPLGWRHELVVGRAGAPSQFRSPANSSPFVTGSGGLGHIVIFAPDKQTIEAFYENVLGMRLSDTIAMGPIELRFFHCNPRHHSVAFVNIAAMAGFHHLMLEVENPDDVGRALDRAKAAGHPISMDIGRHPNDLMTSFYVRTPSGFDIEFGSGGLLVDDATWQTASYEQTSIWGHRPIGDPLPPGILHPFTGALT